MSIKIEIPFDEETPSSLFPDSQNPPGSSADEDCRRSARRGDGSVIPDQETFQAQQDGSPPILLYPVGLGPDSFYSSDGETILKLAPATRRRPAPEKVNGTTEFTYQTIVYLIEAVGRRWSLYGTRERSQLFRSVQKELEAQGHPLPVERIRRKWNNLIVTYKRVKDRGRGTGQAKTSWEYFEMMNAMLGDGVGPQVIGPQIINSATPATMSPDDTDTLVQEYKPLLFPGDDVVTSGLQVAALGPSPLPPADTPIPRATNHVDSLQSADCLHPQLSPTPPPVPIGPPLSSHRAPFYSNARQRRQKGRGFSFHSSSPSSSSSSGQAQQRQLEESTAVLQEVLRRQAEQVGSEQGSSGRSEPRERRRERREIRMAQSLGRIATALELLSSKQDTVIALLQRLADKK